METINFDMLVSGVIFVLAYALIVSDWIDKTVVALSGAALMILVRILSQEDAFKAIDYNTIGLLIGMMVIVMILKRTGIFEFLAIKVVKTAKGDPKRILILLAVITGVLSGLLDNVTTILLILPVTFDIARDLRVSPMPFVITGVFASNVGGTATLVGDPPNIMIGSATGLSFTDFLINDARIAIPLLILTTFIFVSIYRKSLSAKRENMEKTLEMDESKAIKDRRLLVKSLIILGVTMAGFTLHGMLHYESATIAIAGAVALLFISGIKPEKIFHEVEWNTIFFFAGLFIMVGGIEASGIIEVLAKGVLDMTSGNLALTAVAILWVSAIASAFIDNIPFVATMIPLIQDLETLSNINIMPLWWALSLGACLGGNGTIIGASANVIAAGMAEERGHKITFKYFFRKAFPVMLLTIVVSTAYLYLFYLK